MEVHRHLHFNMKPLLVAQYYKDTIMLFLDHQLSSQLLSVKQDKEVCKIDVGMAWTAFHEIQASERTYPSGGEYGT